MATNRFSIRHKYGTLLNWFRIQFDFVFENVLPFQFTSIRQDLLNLKKIQFLPLPCWESLD